MFTPFEIFQKAEIWQIALAIGMFLMVVGIIVAVLVVTAKRVGRAGDFIFKYLSEIFEPLIKDGSVEVVKGFLSPFVKGKLSGKEVKVQYMLQGPQNLKNITRHNIILWQVMIKMPDGIVAKKEQRTQTVKAITTQYGGHVRISGEWLTWYNPSDQPESKVVDLIKKLAKEIQ